MKRIEIRFKGAIVADQCAVADSFSTRLRGLIGRKSLEPGHALLLRRCSSIHTFLMSFPIDAVYLGRNLRVLGIDRDLKPWRLGRLMLGVKAVLEIPSGTADALGFSVGDRLEIV